MFTKYHNTSSFPQNDSLTGRNDSLPDKHKSLLIDLPICHSPGAPNNCSPRIHPMSSSFYAFQHQAELIALTVPQSYSIYNPRIGWLADVTVI